MFMLSNVLQFIIKYSQKKFVAIIVSVFMQIFCLTLFCAFLEHSSISQVIFSRLRSSFLSDLYYSHSKVKLVANIKSIAV